MPRTINDGAEDVPLNLLKQHPRNVNQGDFGAIAESVEANGFFGRLVVNRRTKHILAGNHRYLVAKQQGFETVPVEWVDVDPDAELRILLADNRTARLGSDNEAGLAELLAELAATDKGLVGTGFDGDDLDRLINNLAAGPGVDPAAEWAGMPEFTHEDKSAYRSLVVHFGSEEAVQEFRALVGQPFSPEAKYIWHPKQVRADNMGLRYVSIEDAA